ncbi:MAG: RyR domain-containing protein [Cyclobacteriaceae bacterium]
MMTKEQIIQIARTVHYVNQMYCQAISESSNPFWEDTPEWQKQSVVNGVKFYLENLDAHPCDSHNSWLKKKEEDGWVYGEVKDPKKKHHPCMVPYEKLPKEQQIKDSLFIAVVKSFL